MRKSLYDQIKEVRVEAEKEVAKLFVEFEKIADTFTLNSGGTIKSITIRFPFVEGDPPERILNATIDYWGIK